MNASSPSARGSEGAWLWGPAPDLLLGCGLAYVAFVVVFVLADVRWATRAAPVAIAFLGLALNTPHYGATLKRVYEQRADRRRYALFTLYATLLLVALMAAGLHVVWIGSALITLYISWSPWHFAGQNYGLALMFLRRRGIEVTPQTKRLLYTSFLCSFLLVLLLAHGPFQALGIFPVPSFQREVYSFLSLDLPEIPTRLAIFTVGLVHVASLAVVMTRLLRQSALSTLVPTLSLVALQAMWFTVPAALAATGRLTFTSFALSSIWISFAHSIQYLWITSYYAKRSDASVRLPGYLLSTLAWGGIATVLPALVFAPSALGTVSYHAGLAILVFSVVNLHHFLLDGAIWKLRDGRVASVLLRSMVEPVGAPLEAGARLGRRTVEGVGAACMALAVFGLWENQFGVIGGLQRGDLERVEQASAWLARIGRESHAVHHELGRKYAKAGNWARAQWHFGRSVEIQPSVAGFFHLAVARAKDGELEAAQQDLERALALDPEHLPSLRQMARVSRELGDHARELDALERAAAVAPSDRKVRAALVRARREASWLGSP